MRTLLLSLALVAASACAGEMVLKNRQTGAEIRLGEAPCTNEATIAEIKDEMVPRFRAATALVDGQTYQGCWTEDGGLAILFFENGERFVTRISAFRDPMV